MSFRRTLKIIFWNVGTVVLLIILCEVIVRIVHPEIQVAGTDRKLLEANVYYESVGLKKNSEGESNGVLKKVDENGFWKYSIRKKSNARKILILGDSAAMGLGVEDDSTFVGLLNQDFDYIEFYNASLIGYSSTDYLHVTKSLIEQRKNDLMISDIFIFWCLNDIYSNLPDPDSPEQKSDFIKTITTFLGRNSRLYHFLKNTFSDRSKAYFDYDRQFYIDTNEQLIKSVQNLKVLKQITDTSNVSIKIFLLPYEYQIRKANKPDFFEPQKLFKSLLSDSNFDVIDCSEAFKLLNTPSKDFYLYGDGIHFSKFGHRTLANYLISILK